MLLVVLLILMSGWERMAQAEPVDITASLAEKQPKSSHPEVRTPSANGTMNLLFPGAKLQEIYRNNGFEGCEPSAFAVVGQSESWEDSGRYCLRRVEDEYRNNSFEHSLAQDEVYGVSVHPSAGAEPHHLVEGLPERVFLDATQQIIGSQSSFLASLIAGKISHSIPLGGASRSSSTSRQNPIRPRYVVAYEKVSPNVDMQNLVASVDDAFVVPREQPTMAETFEVRHSPPLFPHTVRRRLIEVPAQGGAHAQTGTVGGAGVGVAESAVQSAQPLQPLGWRERASLQLGLSEPIFSSLVTTLNRNDAERPEGVVFGLAEGSASLLFAEARPLAEDPDKTLTYGFVLPYHAYSLRVQHFNSGEFPKYGLQRAVPGLKVNLSFEESTEKLELALTASL